MKFCLYENNERITLLETFKTKIKGSNLLYSTTHYWLVEILAMSEQTLSSIINIVRTYLSNIVFHEKLSKLVDIVKSSVKIGRNFFRS